MLCTLRYVIYLEWESRVELRAMAGPPQPNNRRARRNVAQAVVDDWSLARKG